MRSPLDGISAFERAYDLTGGGPASITCPRLFALLTRVGYDTVPCTPGLLVRRNAPTPTKEIKDMARKTEAQTTAHQPTAPDFLAWHVTNRGTKSFWNKVGAAWKHRDGQGYTIQLEVVPINGRIVLRQPIEDPAAPATEKETGA